MPKVKMILDLDTGVDDALALAYAVGHEDIDLIGIIASYGNNLTSVTAQNSLDLLDLLGQNDVPVFYGATHSTTTDDFTVMEVSKTIHGQNGVGDVLVPKSKRTISEQSGVDFLIEAAHKYQEQLVYLPTGPLTNLALALEKDPEIGRLIGQTTLMGGALTVPGNVTPFTEANINQDPEAADIVFHQQDKLTMVGLDVTLRTLLTKKHTAEWRAIGTTKAKLYADIMDYYIDAYYNLDIDKRGAALHDPLAVAVAVQPDYVDTMPLNMKVTTDKETGDYGRTIGDTDQLLDPCHSQAAILVDQDRFVSDFQEMMKKVLA